MLYQKLDKSYLVYIIKSHRFLIVNSKIFEFLKIYFSSNNYNDFSLRIRKKRSKKIYNDILKLVSSNNNTPNKKIKKSPLNFNNHITKFYKIKSKLIKINYQNKRLLSIVHPKFKHLETRISKMPASNYYVSLNRNKVLAEFPDAVTSRGSKHLIKLINSIKKGYKPYVLFLTQIQGINNFKIAKDIDNNYYQNYLLAKKAGVNFLAYRCLLNSKEIKIEKRIKIIDE